MEEEKGIALIGSIKICGVSVRTSHRNGQSARDLNGVWSHIIKTDMIGKMPHRVAADILCVYTDYASAHWGDFTMVVGCKVTDYDFPLKGLVAFEIPAGHYKHYQSAGKLPESLQKTWAGIAQTCKNRTFQTDFDHYNPVSFVPGGKAVIDTFVGVKG